MASKQCDNCGFTDGVTESVINGERRVLCASCWDDVETVTRDRERERRRQSDWQYNNPLDPNGFWGR
jgi:predicted sulfurtransferase